MISPGFFVNFFRTLHEEEKKIAKLQHIVSCLCNLFVFYEQLRMVFYVYFEKEKVQCTNRKDFKKSTGLESILSSTFQLYE